MLKYIKQSNILFLTLIILSSCVALHLPDEYVECVHVEDSRIKILYEKENYTEHYSPYCIEFIKLNGVCPKMIEIVDLKDEQKWFSEEEIMNYTCTIIVNEERKEK